MGICRNDIDLGRGAGAQAQFDGAGNLLLVEDFPLHDPVVAAKVFQNGDADGIDGHTIRRRPENVAPGPFTRGRPFVHKGFNPVHDHQMG